jgi:N-acetylmuramoyl-L-alanine amidase
MRVASKDRQAGVVTLTVKAVELNGACASEVSVLSSRLEIRPFFATCRRESRVCLCACALAACTAVLQLGAAQAPTAPISPTSRYVVVLDAAHGGDDPGGHLNGQTGQGLAEEAFTLAMSVRLRSLLAARGIQVITTRESDATVDLVRRAEVANRAKAQVCLSLHGSKSGSGVHLFVSNLPPVQAVRLAPWKTAQAGWVARSVALAGTLNSALLQAGMTVTLGRTALPGVDSMTCPAVAVEIAPEHGPGKKLTAELDDPGYQARMAEALAAALVEWRTEAQQP